MFALFNRSNEDHRIVRRPLSEQRLNRVTRSALVSYVNTKRAQASTHNANIRQGLVDGQEINLGVFARIEGMVQANKLTSFADVDEAVEHLLQWGQ